MSANEFFEKHTIEEINKKTKISPISLRYIKNKEFEKIQRVKFLGFVRIIEKEFKTDLSDLIEEYNQTTNHSPETPEKETVLSEPKKHNTLILFLLALILFSLGAYLLYNNYTSKSPKNSELNKTEFLPNTEENVTNSNTETIQNENALESNETAIRQQETNNTSNSVENADIPKIIEISPHEKVWFKAVNIDNNQTVEYLTSNPKILIGPDWYVKFGHGNLTIVYGNETITPNTKKIIRILFKQGKIEYLKKDNRFEK
jgi:cytoskeletal protein RodZ